MRLRDHIKTIGIALLLGLGLWGALSLDRTSWFPPAAVENETKYYVKIAAVYEGDIDFRFYVTKKMLESMAPQMKDLPLLLGHDWANPNVCVGRVIDSAVKKDKFGHYLEVVVQVNNLETVEMIKKRAYHAISIGFMRIKAICTIDGKAECDHEPGRKYHDGSGALVLARFMLIEVRMCELSFINVPASEHARVLEWANHRLSCSDSK